MDEMTLPPGQHAIEGFPRFGTHLSQPPPQVPADPVIEVGGAVEEPVSFRLAELAQLPRRELTADFHCVAGWSATDLRWEGVAFETFFRTVVRPSANVSHVSFGGLDGFEALLTIEDAMDEDVLIADRLDGRPLDSDHGAPARLVTPRQYGYMNVKHLCRIEAHTERPENQLGAATPFAKLTLRSLAMRHPRARVWEEERHPYLPGWSLRPLYRALIRPFRLLSERGSRER
jgi:DMSO/TMAO reductase YedYZ molybdopterin-dependent catalytic subunit